MRPIQPVEVRRLRYAATINDETLPEETAANYELQYIDIGNVDSYGKIHEIATYIFADAPSRARRIVRDGDVIISTVRTYLQAIAPIQAPPENLIVSTGFAVIRPKPSELAPNFCKYALREPSFLSEVELRSVGVSYPAINASEIGDIPVHLPPLQQQQEIAAYLDEETVQLDKVVAAKEQLLVSLAMKRQAFIIHAVTRGLDSRAPLRDSGISWLRQIPAHWETRRAALLFRERDERGEPELPLLEVSISAGVVLREFSDDRIESTAADFNTYKVARRGDIVFNKMRMWQGAVGVTPEDGLVSPDYTVAEPIRPMSSAYAGQLFRTEMFSAECARNSHGIVWDRLRLYWDGFRDLVLPLPSPEEQAAIVAHIATETAKLDTLRAATEKTIALLKERRAALIAAAVTGQLNIGETT